MDARVRFSHHPFAADALLAARLVEATAALADARSFSVDELHASQHDAVIAVSFALSGLPRQLVDDGLGEVFFNEDTAVSGCGGRHGSLVAMFAFDGRHAVLDAARGCAGDQARDRAYLSGFAYVFAGEREARTFAAACALKTRRREVAAALRRTLELAAPLPIRIAARTLVEAFDGVTDVDRRAWLHELRWTFGHPELDAMHRKPRGG